MSFLALLFLQRPVQSDHSDLGNLLFATIEKTSAANNPHYLSRSHHLQNLWILGFARISSGLGDGDSHRRVNYHAWQPVQKLGGTANGIGLVIWRSPRCAGRKNAPTTQGIFLVHARTPFGRFPRLRLSCMVNHHVFNADEPHACHCQSIIRDRVRCGGPCRLWRRYEGGVL